MNKIETYLSSLITDYFSKFVKNFNPEDVEVSLWNGKVNIQNIELNFDSLNETPLPIQFVSGHVVGLSIFIPWSEILTKPMKCEINTIELVLKLNKIETESKVGERKVEESAVEESEGEESIVEVENEDKGKVKTVENETKKKLNGNEKEVKSEYYIKTLARKTLINATIECRNVIVKINFEDILISLNIQFLYSYSANDKWEAEICEFSLEQYLLRRMLKMNGVTLCVDRVNEIVETPLLNVISAKGRILLKHSLNSRTNRVSATTVVHIFSPLAKVNISSLQLIMIERIIDLATYYLNLSKFGSTTQLEPKQDADNGILSYMYWIWDGIKGFFDKSPPKFEDAPGYNLNVGVFLKEINTNLRFAEIISDKIEYSPIARIKSEEFSSNTFYSKKKWLSTQCEVKSFIVKAFDEFENSERHPLVKIEKESALAYLNESLFGAYAAANSVVMDWTSYLQKYDDNYIAQKSVVLWTDCVYLLDDTKKPNSETLFVRFKLLEMFFYSNSDLITCLQNGSKLLKSYPELLNLCQKLINYFSEREIVIPFGNMQFKVCIEQKKIPPIAYTPLKLNESEDKPSENATADTPAVENSNDEPIVENAEN